MSRNPFPHRRPTPVTASALVDWLSMSMKVTQEAHLRHFGALDYAKAMLDLPDKEIALKVPSQRIATSISITAGDYAVHRLWGRTKVVYDVNPTLMQSLADMETGDALPGGILRQLPHPNPVFVFPGGLPVLHKDQQPGILRAMYVTGRTAENHMCSTHHPKVDNYQLTFNSDLVDEQGMVVDMDSIRISVDLVEGSFTIKGLVDKIIDGYAWEPLLADNASTEQKRNYLEKLAEFGIAHLLYVCSEKADTVRKPVGRKPVKNGQRPEKPIQVHQLGWRIGPAIKAARERLERERSTGGDGSRTVAPHIRRAHLHTFRYGKGRELSKVKWLPPLFVNAQGEEINLDGVIVPVQQ